MKIILISIGNFQEYILENIKNLILFGNTDIDVITEKEYFGKFNKYKNINSIDLINLIDKETLDDFNFNNESCLDKKFRNGFWHLCSLRLFYLYSHLKKNNIKNCIHIENDVLIYKDLNNFNLNTDKVCAVFDCVNRVIPSIIYIPEPDKFGVIISKYQNNLNDMENLSKFGENIIERLPIYSLLDLSDEYKMVTKNYTKYNMIFDGAAIGQYLGGVDPQNISGDTRGFVNETCIIKYNSNKFYWVLDNKLYYPHIEINNKLIPIFNLHIHSKNLHLFNGENPEENNFIKKYN